jgi:hypothetical protein
MPAPNIPDEVVEAAAKALADAIGHGMTEKCEAHARFVIEAALPLLLEQVAWLVKSGDAEVLCAAEGTAKAQAFELRKGGYPAHTEPLYRLKVSNEQ